MNYSGNPNDIKIINIGNCTTLAEMLEIIRKYPYMYLLEIRPVQLQSLLYGWLIGTQNEKEKDILKQFQLFVQRKYNITTSHSWSHILEFYNTLGEYKGLDLFFRVWDEFQAELNKV